MSSIQTHALRHANDRQCLRTIDHTRRDIAFDSKPFQIATWSAVVAFGLLIAAVIVIFSCYRLRTRPKHDVEKYTSRGTLVTEQEQDCLCSVDHEHGTASISNHSDASTFPQVYTFVRRGSRYRLERPKIRFNRRACVTEPVSSSSIKTRHEHGILASTHTPGIPSPPSYHSVGVESPRDMDVAAPACVSQSSSTHERGIILIVNDPEYFPRLETLVPGRTSSVSYRTAPNTDLKRVNKRLATL